MPRNSSGTYALPAGNPVSTNTVIETAWGNPTMSDLGAALTDSLDRYGRGTMLAAMKLLDGSAAAPGLTWNSEASSGLYRAASHDIRVSVAGVDVVKWTDTGATFPKGITVTGTTTFADITTGNITLAAGKGIDGTGATSGGWHIGQQSPTGNLELRSNAAAGITGTIDVNAIVADGTSSVAMRVFRNTNTTGGRTFQILRGDGTTVADHLLAAGATAVSSLCRVAGQRLLVGGTTDNTIDTLQVMGTARVRSGTYGGPVANAAADDLVIEGAGPVGLTVLTPANSYGVLSFGNPSAVQAGYMQYDHAGTTMRIGTNSLVALTITQFGITPLGGVYAPDGTAAAPSYTFTSSVNTGLYRPAAGVLAFTTSGVEAGRFTAAAAGEFLVGATTASLSATGRGLIEVSGSTTAFIGVDIAGVNKGSMACSGTSFVFNSVVGVPTIFQYNSAEVARIDTDSSFQYQGIEVGWRSIPMATKSGAYPLVLGDRGKSIRGDAGASITVPANVFSAGDVVTIYNNNSGGNLSIAAGSGMGFRWGAGTAVTTTPRSVQYNGLVTLFFINGTTCVLTGTGIL